MTRKIKKEINQEIKDIKSKIFSLQNEYVALSNKRDKTFDEKARMCGIISDIHYLNFDLHTKKRVIEIVNQLKSLKIAQMNSINKKINPDLHTKKTAIEMEQYTNERQYNLFICNEHGIYAVEINFNDKTCPTCKSTNKMLTSDEINDLLNIHNNQ
jgi:rubrerythrin